MFSYLDLSNRTRELNYIIFVENTKAQTRLTMTKKVLQSLFSEMREQSFFMLAVLDSSDPLWITKEEPMACSKKNLKWAEEQVFKSMGEPVNSLDKKGEFLVAMKTALEMRFPSVDPMPRSFIMVGQGTVDYQNRSRGDDH